MGTKEKNLYHILGISYEADKSTIEIAYRQLALLYHPDRNRNEEAASIMAEINHAYEILGNIERRKEYDRAHFFYYGKKPIQKPSQKIVEPIINQRDWIPRGEVKGNHDLSYLVLQLHYHPYAVQLTSVRSVLPPQTIQWVENKPEWISGIIEHQGRFYPAADLRVLLDLSLPEENISEPFLLCEIHGTAIAVQIDKALRTHVLPKTEIKAVPKMDEELTFSFLNGLYLDQNDQVVLILNLDGLLDETQKQELADFMSALALN
jgi:chemotaxis signal transduction protein